MRYYITLLLSVGLLVISSPSAYGLTKDQEKNLALAYIVGSSIGLPETMQAICIVESSCRMFVIGDKDQKTFKRSYGLTQIKIATVRATIKHYRLTIRASDVELRDMLLNNAMFNLYLSSLHFRYLLDRYNGNWQKAVVGYNYGIAGVEKVNYKKTRYLKKIIWHIHNTVRPYNKKIVK